ncbi:hypothetical protein [Salinimicrobium sp. TH3]|uniref:hypothetical protein n=1 Tax=Salinimicrobium sp. TH3 TaxID=2997342 RepID=UPI0022741982|nr:hypothetical protein [Salinimicrobium sp. TH3]MCY2687588.1 hypothetical protein [Salinimicrobium sp. TH3]
MDAIDNLIYSALNDSVYPSKKHSLPIIIPEELNISKINPTKSSGNITFYKKTARNNFVSLDDPGIIEDTIRKHWFDVSNRISYTNEMGRVDEDDAGNIIPLFEEGSNAPLQAYIKFNTPPYHMIFSYLVENTRIAQIFEKMIGMYLQDEKLTKAEPEAFRWILNTETLFYNSAPGSYTTRASQVRPVSEANRRNAYHRLFGMDLAFGDLNNNKYEYHKAEFSNSGFISLFENFLVEFWRGYINANNTSGTNTTDTEHLEDLARKLQEMLMSRRTTSLNFENYRYFNLSAEEYSSYIFMYWLFNVVSYDSPLVKFLKAEANTAGDRLMNIGRRIGLNAHTKSVAILDIAQPMSTLLRSIELGILNDSAFLFRIIRALTVNPANPPEPQEVAMLNNLLLIINNWEKATGHRIKNAENVILPAGSNGSISGKIKVQSNGTSKSYTL